MLPVSQRYLEALAEKRAELDYQVGLTFSESAVFISDNDFNYSIGKIPETIEFNYCYVGDSKVKIPVTSYVDELGNINTDVYGTEVFASIICDSIYYSQFCKDYKMPPEVFKLSELEKFPLHIEDQLLAGLAAEPYLNKVKAPEVKLYCSSADEFFKLPYIGSKFGLTFFCEDFTLRKECGDDCKHTLVSEIGDYKQISDFSGAHFVTCDFIEPDQIFATYLRETNDDYELELFELGEK